MAYIETFDPECDHVPTTTSVEVAPTQFIKVEVCLHCRGWNVGQGWGCSDDVMREIQPPVYRGSLPIRLGLTQLMEMDTV